MSHRASLHVSRLRARGDVQHRESRHMTRNLSAERLRNRETAGVRETARDPSFSE